MDQTAEDYICILSQNLDFETVEESHKHLKEAIASKKKVILDFAKVKMISAPSLQLLVIFSKSMQQNNLTFCIKNLTDDVKNMLNELGLKHDLEQVK